MQIRHWGACDSFFSFSSTCSPSLEPFDSCDLSIRFTYILSHVTNRSMWMFGHEGGTSLFYLPQHPLVGDGVKVTACHPSLSFLRREGGCCLVLGPPAGPRQSRAHWGPLSDNSTWAWQGGRDKWGHIVRPQTEGKWIHVVPDSATGYGRFFQKPQKNVAGM